MRSERQNADDSIRGVSPKILDDEIREGESSQQLKETRRPSPEDPKSKDAPMSVTRAISLNKRAEEKPSFERLLQQGARKLLRAAIEMSSSRKFNFTRIGGMRMGSGFWQSGN
jgi:hypothetical protein